MNNIKDILRLFAQLRKIATGSDSDPELITARVWSEAHNGRVIHQMGPESSPGFVTLRVGWEGLIRPGKWEVTVNWSAYGSQTPVVAGQYAVALAEAATKAANQEAVVKDAPGLDPSRPIVLAAFWDAAKASLGEDAKPDDVAAAAYLLVCESEPQSEAETILGALQANPDNDELWDQAQTFLKRISAAP